MLKQIKKINFFTRYIWFVTLILVTFFITAGIVFAVDWVGPTADPPTDNRPGYIWNVIDTPTTGQIDAVINISGTGKIVAPEICVPNAGAGNCSTDLTNYWSSGTGNSIYYDGGDGGNIGIGINNPNRLLHLKTETTDTYPNAEIDIQSGDQPYWAIYQDFGWPAGDLSFWNNEGVRSKNILTLSANWGIPSSGRNRVTINGNLNLRDNTLLISGYRDGADEDWIVRYTESIGGGSSIEGGLKIDTDIQGYLDDPLDHRPTFSFVDTNGVKIYSMGFGSGNAGQVGIGPEMADVFLDYLPDSKFAVYDPDVTYGQEPGEGGWYSASALAFDAQLTQAPTLGTWYHALMGIANNFSPIDLLNNQNRFTGVLGSARNSDPAGNIKELVGVSGEVFNISLGSTVKKAAALRAWVRSGGAGYPDGTIDNAYGLYVDPAQIGTNRYAIYTEGPDQSYFGGKVTIEAGENLCLGASCRSDWPAGSGTTLWDDGGTFISSPNNRIQVDKRTSPTITGPTIYGNGDWGVWLTGIDPPSGTIDGNQVRVGEIYGDSGLYTIENMGFAAATGEFFWTGSGGGGDIKMQLNNSGNLFVTGGISTYDTTVADNTVETSQLCLGNGINCRTTWPSGSFTPGKNNCYMVQEVPVTVPYPPYFFPANAALCDGVDIFGNTVGDGNEYMAGRYSNLDTTSAPGGGIGIVNVILCCDL